MKAIILYVMCVACANPYGRKLKTAEGRLGSDAVCQHYASEEGRTPVIRCIADGVEYLCVVSDDRASCREWQASDGASTVVKSH